VTDISGSPGPRGLHEERCCHGGGFRGGRGGAGLIPGPTLTCEVS
jgi:hypothetical protein